MTNFYLTENDLILYVLSASAWLSVGALTGTFHLLTLRWNVGMFATGQSLPLALAIQLARFAVIAGVLGTHKFVYDVWGDTVNTAKRMESYGLPGQVHVSAATRQALGDAFRFEPRGPLEIKGKGLVETYFLYRHERPC